MRCMLLAYLPSYYFIDTFISYDFTLSPPDAAFRAMPDAAATPLISAASLTCRCYFQLRCRRRIRHYVRAAAILCAIFALFRLFSRRCHFAPSCCRFFFFFGPMLLSPFSYFADIDIAMSARDDADIFMMISA